jgi:hypothetical protein
MARPFGPNTRLIERFLERLAHMDVGEYGGVVQRWRDALAAENGWYAAEDAVGDAIAATRRDGEMWLLQDRLYAIFRDAPWYTRQPLGAPHAPPEVASQYLATSAAVALLVADVLEAKHLNVLYGPFAAAIPLTDVALGAWPAVEQRGGATSFDTRSRDTGRDTRH